MTRSNINKTSHLQRHRHETIQDRTLVLLSGWLLYVFGKIKCLSVPPHIEGASLLKASIAMDAFLVFIVIGVGMLTDGQPPKPVGVHEFAVYILFVVYIDINDFLSKELSVLILLTKVLSGALLLCFLIRVSQNLNSPYLANTGNRVLKFTAAALFSRFLMTIAREMESGYLFVICLLMTAIFVIITFVHIIQLLYGLKTMTHPIS